jgi:hypothetical protein
MTKAEALAQMKESIEFIHEFMLRPIQEPTCFSGMGGPMHFVYCSDCGTKLKVGRKAMPKYNTIIDVIEPHVCPEEMVELDLKPDPLPPFVKLPKGKFMTKLDELQAAPLPEGSGDRRPTENVRKEITSTAPRNVLDQLKSGNTPDED